jgi:hypothetical protein
MAPVATNSRVPRESPRGRPLSPSQSGGHSTAPPRWPVQLTHGGWHPALPVVGAGRREGSDFLAVGSEWQQPTWNAIGRPMLKEFRTVQRTSPADYKHQDLPRLFITIYRYKAVGAGPRQRASRMSTTLNGARTGPHRRNTAVACMHNSLARVAGRRPEQPRPAQPVAGMLNRFQRHRPAANYC